MFKPPTYQKKLHEDGLYWYNFPEEWDRKRIMYGNTIMTFTLIVLIISMAFLAVVVTKNIQEVRANPLLYGARKLGGGTECTCTKLNAAGELIMFHFDNESMKLLPAQSHSLL